MSVRSHLEDTASKLLLQRPEHGSIVTSLNTLESRLKNDEIYTGVREHFSFGSWNREVNLPRRADDYSDVDYMIVFHGDTSTNPQTLLDRLKRFVDRKYQSSDVRQSHPTMVLSLNHIHFELVPAVRYGNTTYGDFQIPSKDSAYSKWQSTYPNQAAQALTDKNKNNSYLIKPLVRLLKYWNCLADYQTRPFTSFELEQHLLRQYYFNCNNLKDFFYQAVEGLPIPYNISQFCKDRITRLKEVVGNAKRYEIALESEKAEAEIKKVIPVFE